MAFSSGARNSLQMVAGWVIAAALGVGVIANFDQVRSILGLKLEPGDFGVAAAANDETRTVAKESASRGGRTVEIRANRSGHYETRAHVNGRPVEVMVDTGATVVALTWEDAQAAGVHVRDSDFKHSVSTANGTARVAAVTLDTVSIDDITVRDVRAVVAERGRLQTTLLGMSFLSRLGKAEMSRGLLVLQE